MHEKITLFTASFRIIFLAAVLLPVILQSCICATEGVNRGDINLYPIGQEWELGKELASQLDAELPLVRDPAALSYLNDLGTEIVAQTELHDRPWQFYLVADTAVNAFALPGGHIYVNTALIEAADSVSELAGVLAHEVAHITARHSTERLTRAFGFERLTRIILDQNAGILEQIIAEIVGQGVFAKFSRDDEREADRLGLDYMLAAGYDPAGMLSFFEDLLVERRRKPDLAEQFFATHPLTEERIQTIAGLTAARSFLAENLQGESEFEKLKQRLKEN